MNILVVDIETTDFLNRGGLIVEVGIVKLNLLTGEVEKIYDQLVKEEGFNDDHKHSWIFKNSSLTWEEVNNARPLDVNTLKNIFSNYPATAYNKRFDFDFLSSRGIIIKELDCPMKLMTPICKINGPYGFKWPKVQEAYDFLFPNNDYTEEHRGLDDAHHEAKIVHWLHKQGYFKVVQ